MTWSTQPRYFDAASKAAITPIRQMKARRHVRMAAHQFALVPLAKAVLADTCGQLHRLSSSPPDLGCRRMLTQRRARRLNAPCCPHDARRRTIPPPRRRQIQCNRYGPGIKEPQRFATIAQERCRRTSMTATCALLKSKGPLFAALGAAKPGPGRPRRFAEAVGCTDCPAVLTLMALAHNSLRALRALRSDRCASQRWWRAARAGHDRRAPRRLRGAPQPARARLCGNARGVRAKTTDSATSRQAASGGGDFCGDEERSHGVGARSALRDLTCRRLFERSARQGAQ